MSDRNLALFVLRGFFTTLVVILLAASPSSAQTTAIAITRVNVVDVADGLIWVRTPISSFHCAIGFGEVKSRDQRLSPLGQFSMLRRFRRHVANAEQARLPVRDLKRRGVDFIKVRPRSKSKTD